MSKSTRQLFKESVEEVISNKKNESVVDKPVSAELCPDVWEKNDEIGYVLTEQADVEIKKVCEKVIDFLKLKEVTVRIVGSICSNSYSDSSDIDIHISSPSITKSNAEELNDKLKDLDLSEFHIGVHPFEVYAQYNVFIDMMSVGCFDYINEEWIVGPTIYDVDFDPMEEYFEDAMKHLGTLYDDIHRLVLDAYDNARIIVNLSDKNGKLFKKLSAKQKKFQKDAKALIKELKKKRTFTDVPKSEEEALKIREKREFKVYDASLKLMGKLGYIDALKEIRGMDSHDEDSPVAQSDYVIGGVSKNICQNKE